MVYILFFFIFLFFPCARGEVKEGCEKLRKTVQNGFVFNFIIAGLYLEQRKEYETAQKNVEKKQFFN